MSQEVCLLYPEHGLWIQDGASLRELQCECVEAGTTEAFRDADFTTHPYWVYHDDRHEFWGCSSLEDAQDVVEQLEYAIDQMDEEEDE